MSVDEATLELGQINIFIGPTDSGKSTLMRAIDAVITNKFPAATYATHGSQRYAIAIVTEKGVVQIIKSKSTQYQTVTIDGEEKISKEFNAVGRETPPEAKQILNMPYLPISDTEVLDVLYQSQHKPFFLITENRDVFSKVIALISNADKLRSLEKLVNSDILINKRNVTQLKDAVLDYDRTIAVREVEVSNLEKYKNLNLVYIDLLKSSEEAQTKISKLTSLIELNKELAFLERQSSVKQVSIQDTSELAHRVSQISSLRDSFSQLQISIPDNISVPEFLPISVTALAQAFEDSVAQVPEKVNVPEFKHAKLQQLREFLAESSTLLPSKVEDRQFNFSKLVELRTVIKNLIDINSALQALEDVKEQIKSQVSELEGSICPVCGNVLDVEHLNNITENV
jgi:energy-coupling factor transporter ATP-binding protein EcfA2